MVGSPSARKPVLSLLGVLLLAAAVVPVVPASAAATEGKQPHGSIYIDEAADFNPANGVRSGSGTAQDPFVISDWTVNTVSIRDTDAYVSIHDNEIQRLVLDWVGDRVDVQNNDISDLRVNQNVRRTGEATNGVIANNTFDVVGQLRHFDGDFSYNVVGDPQTLLEWPWYRAVNFDGFNGARFHHNTIYGYMDARLHGHHHGSGWRQASHYHGGTEHSGGAVVDHSKRYHEVFITDNKIYSTDGYALRYTDSGHSINDRTAASETDPSLKGPHVHYTRIRILANELVGSGLKIDIFNADDEYHAGTARGLLAIRDNRVVIERDPTALFRSYDGIDIARAKDVTMQITGNSVRGLERSSEDVTGLQRRMELGDGIVLRDVDLARIFLADNEVGHARYGIRASRFTETVVWSIDGLQTTDVEMPVYYDSTVKNRPGQNP